MKQFWSVGFTATSLQDLLRVMGLSKSSFYQTFGSKHELFLRCLELYQSRLIQRLKGQMAGEWSGIGFIRNLFSEVILEASRPEKYGCLLVNTAGEFAQRDTEIAQLVSRGLEKLRQLFLRAIRQAQSQGDVESEKDAELLARYLVTTICGIRSMIKGGTEKKDLEMVVKIALGVLG
ncbi:TetR/AcrR family transcriptional regulator [Geothermobacter hydrogeniphilus]|nr:TetR/AcrR family transcriptional regulator [Geothermobacter hydrogeniphilus]